MKRFISLFMSICLFFGAVTATQALSPRHTMTADAAAEYLSWKYGDKYTDMINKYYEGIAGGKAFSYEYVYAYMLADIGLESSDPSRFNPYIYASSNELPNFDWVEGECCESVAEDASAAEMAVQLANNYVGLTNKIKKFKNDKKPVILMAYNYVKYPYPLNYYYITSYVSDTEANLYDPYGKIKTTSELDLSLNIDYIQITDYDKSRSYTNNEFTPVLPSNGKYYIKNSKTGTYMNVEGGKDANAANIGLAANTGSTAFVMNVSAVKSGTPAKGTVITPACTSTKVLNAYADKVVNGTNVNIYTKDNTTSQQWIWEKVSGNNYIIHNAQNQNLVLTANGTNVCVKILNGDKSQIWTIEQAISLKAISGKYYLKNKGTGTYAYVEGKANTNGSNIGLAAKKTTTAFQMNIAPVNKGNALTGCYVTPASGSKVMNPYSDTPSNGTNVTLYTKNTDGTQYWLFEPVSGGYIIHNYYNKNLVLNANGKNMNIATNKKSDNQIWVLESVDTTTTTTTTTTKTTTTTTTTKATTTTTTTTTTSEPEIIDYKTGAEYDGSPMKIGESRKVYILNGDTKAAVGVRMVQCDTDIIKYAYNEGDDFLTITAAKNGDAEIFVYGEDCVFPASVKLSVLDEEYVDSKMLGDANCDGSVNMADAVFIMQSVSNPDKYKLSEQGQKNADVDGSGDVTNKDALKIQQFKLGLVESL